MVVYNLNGRDPEYMRTHTFGVEGVLHGGDGWIHHARESCRINGLALGIVLPSSWSLPDFILVVLSGGPTLGDRRTVRRLALTL